MTASVVVLRKLGSGCGGPDIGVMMNLHLDTGMGLITGGAGIHVDGV